MAALPAALHRTHRNRPRRPVATSHRAGAAGTPVARRSSRNRRWLEWPILIGAAVGVAILLRVFVLQSFWIPSDSMNDTLKKGDRVVVSKLSYKIHSIHRGDVIVFSKPSTWNVPDEDLIKRVIAVGGDTVSGSPDGAVYVNGKKIKKGAAKFTTPCFAPLGFAERKIPAHQLWVMGDNRCDSSDSRFNATVPTKDVIGHAVVLFWPFSRFDWL